MTRAHPDTPAASAAHHPFDERLMTTPPPSRDPRFDAYIAEAAPFARPILAYLRDVVHTACPEVVETIKWSRPFFDYRGGTLCFMSAFKSHCGFGFWRGKELDGVPQQQGEDGMGHFGRIGSIDDLPPKRALTGHIKAAMKLAESDPKPVRAKAAPKAEAAMPDDLLQALQRVAAAAKHFAAFSPSAKREYIDWICEAKRPETRASRIASTVEWSADHKTRHWKYQ